MAKTNNIILEKKENDKFDWITISVVLLLITAGLISIYSATYESRLSSYFYRQLIATGLGLAGMFVISFLSDKFIKRISIPVYLISIALLIAVLFFGITSYGTKGWLPVLGFTLQPAEFAKLGLIMILALHFSTKGSNPKNFRDIVIAVALFILPFILINLQPDFGTSTVFVVVLFGILFWAGLDNFFVFIVTALPVIVITALKEDLYFIITAVVLSIVAFLFRKKIWLSIVAVVLFVSIGISSPLIYENLKPHQQARIDTFLNPGSDPQGSGYNVIQSLMAVGSGGLTGKGFLQGTQTQLKYIPMQWTDFIYSVPNEEFGFIGGTIIIILFTVLIYRIISLASKIKDKFYSILLIGIATIFLYHFLINVGMVIGLMPVMGIPLPFMSYGGTSVLINLTFIGFVLNAERIHNMQSTGYS